MPLLQGHEEVWGPRAHEAVMPAEAVHSGEGESRRGAEDVWKVDFPLGFGVSSLSPAK